MYDTVLLFGPPGAGKGTWGNVLKTNSRIVPFFKWRYAQGIGRR